MNDVEKTVDILKHCIDDKHGCHGCPNRYTNGMVACKEFWDGYNAIPKSVIHDAIALLKEQEPVKPEYKLLPGSEKIHEWECGNCGYSLFMILNHENRYSAKSVVHYCAGCGRPVKWDE